MRVRANPGDGPRRADAIVAAHFPGVGRRRIAELFARGAVTVGGRPIKKGQLLPPGTEIELSEAPERPASARPHKNADLDLTVLYRDQHLLAIAKPGGVPCHPLRPEELATVANALVARHPECADASEHAREAGLVHRLDIGTSGVLLAARDRQTWLAMRRAFSARTVSKLYWALTRWRDTSMDTCDQHTRGVIDAPLVQRGARVRVARSPGQAHDQTPDRSGSLDARTEWRVLAHYLAKHSGGYRLLECAAHTGRPHQIRVHLAHLGAPIVGDTHYGGPPSPTPITGFFLHARAISFVHPHTGRDITIEAPVPADRQDLLAALDGPRG